MQFLPTEEPLPADEIIRAVPAISDINVVASEQEVVHVDESAAAIPVTVVVMSADAGPALVPAAVIETAAADRDDANSSPAEVKNWGTEPEYDVLLQPDEVQLEIVPASATAKVPTLASATPVSLSSIPPAADESSATACSISTALAGIMPTPDAIPATPTKSSDRKRKNEELRGAGTKRKTRRKSGTEKSLAGTTDETNAQGRLPGYALEGTSGADSPP